MQPAAALSVVEPFMSRCLQIWPVIEVRMSEVCPLIGSHLVVLPALVSKTDALLDKQQHGKLTQKTVERTPTLLTHSVRLLYFLDLLCTCACMCDMVGTSDQTSWLPRTCCNTSFFSVKVTAQICSL